MSSTGPAVPEYLSPLPSPRRHRRRTPLLAVSALAVIGVVAAGGWAAMSLLSDGTQPSAAVPASALGYLSVDLDPTASQKLEALRIIDKFPALDEELGLDATDDLRRWVFDRLQGESVCENLDYDGDIAPWIGDRLALAAVPAGRAGEGPVPLLALQVTDPDAAAKGITALAECGEVGEDFGFALADGYALISDSEAHARSLAAAAAESSLADDAEFQKWTAKAGDPGIVTMYAAPGALAHLTDLQGDLAQGWLGSAAGDDPAMGETLAEMERMNGVLGSMYDGVGAMAAVVRFEGGAVEAQFASAPMPPELSWAVGAGPSHVSELPAGTAAAVSVGIPEGWLDGYLELLGGMAGEAMPPTDELMTELEAQTGLELPEDVETLLGDSVSLAVDGDLDLEAAERDPAQVRAGLRVSGDPAEITRVLDKLRAAVGPAAEMLVVEQGDGVVAMGLNADYVRALAEQGTLGGDVTFGDVVPDAERSTSAVYVNFDTVSRWVERGMRGNGATGTGDQEVLDNLAPLAAVGASSWTEDDGSLAGLFRLTTD